MYVKLCAFLYLTGALPGILETCCEQGKSWFTTSRERCSVNPGPFEGVEAEDTMTCQAVVELCCLGKKQVKQCTQGKQIARIRQSCDALHSQLGNWHSRVRNRTQGSQSTFLG